MQIDETTRERARVLIGIIRDPTLPEELIDEPMTELARILSCPHVSDYLFHENPELSVEEVIDKALAYRPIAL
ncbi:e9imm peptide [Longispora albida]|uniref:e9imm peptide n=1 Tax=Longispora albida TaxID=203523 RepID=UPI0012F822A6|nr:e9imm peptide [Longispora albida]